MDNEEMYFCMVGVNQVVVPKSNITIKVDLLIKASKVYLVVPQGSQISGAGGRMMVTVGITSFNDVLMQCDFVCNLEPENQLYKEVLKVMAQERKVN